MDTLENSLNKFESNEEQNFSQNQEVVLNLRELLVCFVSLTLGLIISIIVFGLEIIIFLKNGFHYTTARTLPRRHYRARRYYDYYFS